MVRFKAIFCGIGKCYSDSVPQNKREVIYSLLFIQLDEYSSKPRFRSAISEHAKYAGDMHMQFTLVQCRIVVTQGTFM